MTYEQILTHNEKLKEPFKDLQFFEEGHKYIVKGSEDRPIKSVSSLLKFLHEPFDSKIVAKYYAKSRGFEVSDVLDAWEGEGLISTVHGSKVHLIAEDYVRWKYFNIGSKPKIIDKKSLGAIEFINSLPDYLIPVAIELQMYSKVYWYSGTADIILYNTKTGKYWIADYKTNASLTDEHNKKPLFHVDPVHGLIQDNFGKYNAQFSFYQILLEEAGFEIEGRVLIWLNEDKENKKLYRTFRTADITEDLKVFLEKGLHLI